MSGDWIKMRVNLVAHPKVLRMAEALLSDRRYIDWSALSYGIAGFPPSTVEQDDAERRSALRVTRYVVVSSLLRFWGYANEHAKGEKIECVTRQDVDDIAGVPGFADALSQVQWAVFDPKKGGVKLPEFGDHNTSADERKTTGADRQKRYRQRLKNRAPNGDVLSNKHGDVTSYVTSGEREEKIREEKETPPTPKGEGRFPDFWSSWPSTERKQDRKKCLAKWQRNGWDSIADEVIAHVAAMKATRKWLDGYEPAPLTYLNGERWSDGVDVAPAANDIFAGAH